MINAADLIEGFANPDQQALPRRRVRVRFNCGASRQAIEGVALRRKAVALLAPIELNAMLNAAQKFVGRAQSGIVAIREQSLVIQCPQSVQRSAGSHPSLASAVEPLQALSEQLDIADSARVALHVEGLAPALQQALGH